ncbi:hypothetical protein MTR_7g451290 [Medicago truncatula]|uniref:Uncharacterized protein n=1 Tax=Medicago truncatula TaxID=3880 RepID=A0A072TYH9_MEDTR|nr:hypothetical protein MTR_7g451290 [Medicago truncatula]
MSMNLVLQYVDGNLELRGDEDRVITRVKEITKYFHGDVSKEDNPLGVSFSHHLCDHARQLYNLRKNCCFNESLVAYYLEQEPHPSSSKSLNQLNHLFQRFSLLIVTITKPGRFKFY